MSSADEATSLAQPDIGRTDREAGPRNVTILVCSSCRGTDGSDARPRPGERLGEAAQRAVSDERIGVRQVECLGNCKRRLSASYVMEGAWSYVFGDLDEANAEDLVAGATLFLDTKDGLLPWRGRPDCLKRGLIARIPPISNLKDPL